jgi:hypothetical protein
MILLLQIMNEYATAACMSQSVSTDAIEYLHKTSPHMRISNYSLFIKPTVLMVDESENLDTRSFLPIWFDSIPES